MFKKIEIWILYLTILLSILFAFSFGVLIRQELVGTTKAGWITRTALNIVEQPLRLIKILSGETTTPNDKHKQTPYGFSGDTLNFESFLFLSRFDDELKEGVVELVDLRTFEVLQTWNPDLQEFNSLINSSDPYIQNVKSENRGYLPLYHPYLDDDGGLVFGWNGPLRKIDAENNLVWQNDKYRFHHSIEADHNGNIWVPISLYSNVESELTGNLICEYDPYGFCEDGLALVSSEGRVLNVISLIDVFKNNDLDGFFKCEPYCGDPFHLNDIEPVLEDGKFWQKGDLFLSLRSHSIILLFRPSTGEIVHALIGKTNDQHDVDILSDKEISIYDNNRIRKYDNSLSSENRVLIYDFEQKKYSEYLKSSISSQNISSPIQSLHTILPNKDLFIEETMMGRLLYFNSDGELIWTYKNWADNNKVGILGWSRIIYEKNDLEKIRNFLNNK